MLLYLYVFINISVQKNLLFPYMIETWDFLDRWSAVIHSVSS